MKPDTEDWVSDTTDASTTEVPERPPLETPAADVRAKAKPSSPRWEADARERVRAAIRKYQKPLTDLVARDANEGDTRLLVTDLLCDALGYDKYEDLTTEYAVKGDFADYGIRIDKQLVAFIEVKRASQKLNDRHLRQAQSYAVNEGVEWIWLTNGSTWRVYHLTGGLPVIMDLVIDVDLLNKDTAPAKKAEALFLLSRESMKRKQIDDLWRAKKATSPKALAHALLSESVIDAVRKEVRKSSGQKVDAREVTDLLRDTVIRSECFGP